MEHLSLNSCLENKTQTENSELLEIKIGSQGLRKKIVKKGISWQTPFPGDDVEGTKKRKNKPHKLLSMPFFFFFFPFFFLVVQEKGQFVSMFALDEVANWDLKNYGFRVSTRRLTRNFLGMHIAVSVHFSGHIEGGASLDSNRDRGIPFKFKLGQGEVIKGWDEGVATMKNGERAIFTVPPNLAYGEAGSPPLIAPNATLVFDIEMLSWSSIRDLTGDGGILKKIIKEGEGWATPRDGDEVLVKYEARLENGMLVSKSEEGVEFHIGDGYLCPALSRAVKTMRKGEKAELAVKFSYGFIQKGNLTPDIERSIPPDSNLTIQLELVSWRSVIDVTGDKKVLKKIVKAGEGFDRPTEGSLVKVTYAGKLEDGTVFDRKGTNEEPFEFITLEEQVSEGLDRAIMTMKKGEHAIVTTDAEYLRGHDVLGRLPANSFLHYEVELIDFIKEKPFWKMDTNEKLEASERKKLDGNVLFKAGNFWRASKKYEKAAKYIEFDHSFTDEEMRLAKGLRLSCYLNNAACKLKLGEYLEASRLCTKALELDPLNVKALFRRSQAHLRTSELEKAEADIKKALAIDPNNREVKLEYKELKDKQREYAKYQAELFSTMLSRMN